ncbi:MAG: ABC transporter permease [Candidatus Glassbacteria bacterium]|nr:ABC transporter permease [Candidatus Glassbacteria bacterium]
MYYLKLVGQFYQDMRRQKLRTFLTMFGICWGTIAVVLLLAFGVGLEARSRQSMHGMGTNVVILWGSKTTMPFEGMGIGRQIRFRQEDAEYLERKIPQMALISAEYSKWNVKIIYKKNARSITLKGVQPSFGELRNIIPEQGGRFLNDLDMQHSRRTIFLGNKLRDALFGEGSNPAGRVVMLGGVPYTVVGVLQKKTQNSNYSGSDENMALIPASTFRGSYGHRYADNLVYRAVDPDLSELVNKDVYRELGRRFKFDPADKEALSLWDTTEGDRFIKYFFMGFKAFLAIAGVFTLLVGGIGVANIMYVVVRERRREVGIKMALGATGKTILMQFMVETFLIVALGAGVGFGFSAAVVQVFKLPIMSNVIIYVGTPTISPAVALGTMLVLGIVGFSAGYAPARRAARMDPVRALEF